MKRTLRWLLVRFILLIGFVAVGALVAGNAYRIYGQYKLDEDFAPPGKLISIGSHRMHIHCLGSGRPVVVMDAGAGGFSTAWFWIHGPTASFTRVCAFDRSGMGWSESGPANPTPKSRARELEALLAASGEPPPYLLVGHSLGGALAWLYTQDHLEQAAGLIMVDGLPPDLDDRIPREPNRAFLARARIVHTLGLDTAVRYLLDAQAPMCKLLPASEQRLCEDARHYLSQDLLLELTSLGLAEEATREMRHLGELPLVVITHGEPGNMFTGVAISEAAAEARWQEMQAAMSNLSSNGRFLVAESSDHLVPLRTPEVVIESIKDLVLQYRGLPQNPLR